MANESEDHLPALKGPLAWYKAIFFFAVLVLINIAAMLFSYGFGVIITLPITIFMGFLLAREMIPRHRFPTGRRPQNQA